ncbi:putative Ig domain-containing protein, partial [Streptococcus acidominimus]
IAEKEITIKVQRDTDGDQDPDVTDPDDDNDGYTDEHEKAVGTDPKDPNDSPLTSIDGFGVRTVLEKQPIDPITISVKNLPHNGTVEVDGLPDGLTYDPVTGTITGRPTVTDWGKEEEERDFVVSVIVNNGKGDSVAGRTTILKVLRDTDGDQDPDVTDPDDDNDGYTDEKEKIEGTDSKDPNSKPGIPTVGNLEDKTVIEKQPIEAIDIPIANVPKGGNVYVAGLPGGLTYDPTTGKITGTPIVPAWSSDEEEANFLVTVFISDADGKTVAEKDFIIKVQRDTDGDQDPDVTDPDDDNDGYTDEQEKNAGTDSKDPNSKPGAATVKPAGKAILPKTGTETSNLGVYGLAALGAVGLLSLGKGKKEEEE